jgi:hypothetical protein
METEAPGTGLPSLAGRMPSQTGQLSPAFPSIDTFENCGVLCARIYKVRVAQIGLKMPDSFKFKSSLGAIVEKVRADRILVGKLIIYGIKTLAAIIRSLNNLPKPLCRL